MTERKLVANMIRTPDGTILQSFHGHDYKTYFDEVSKEVYMVDGGINYLRRNVTIVPAEELSLYDDAPFHIIREHMSWGTRGKSGTLQLTYKPLALLSNDHIQAILDTQYQISSWLRGMFQKELEYRKEQQFRVEE